MLNLIINSENSDVISMKSKVDIYHNFLKNSRTKYLLWVHIIKAKFRITEVNYEGEYQFEHVSLLVKFLYEQKK